MRLARFAVNGIVKTGRVEGDRIIPLADTLSFEEIVGGGDSAREAAQSSPGGEHYTLTDVRLVAPVPTHPRCLFATGWNYHSHFAEGVGVRPEKVEEPEFPTFFAKPATTIVGPNDPICIDARLSREFDYEAELAVVIGRGGRDIDAEGAMAHVFGYTAANDVSARDIQRRYGGQWFKGKGIDATCPLGPWIVTADEVTDPTTLNIECHVNGEVRQQATTSTMAFSVARLIHELSAGMALLPGDILLTGTPAGVGWARKPPKFLADGDELVTRISRIGEMRNRVQQIR